MHSVVANNFVIKLAPHSIFNGDVEGSSFSPLIMGLPAS